MGVGLTFTQYAPSPSPAAVPTTPGGGTWTAATRCVTVFASYSPTGAITDVDNIGVDRSSPANWSNVAFALNDQLVATFAPGTAGAGGIPRYANKYCLAYQAAATPNWANPWTIVAQTTNPFATSLTAADPTSLGTITLNSTSTIVTVGSVNHMELMEANEKTLRSYTNSIIPRSLVNRSYCNAILMQLPGGAMTHSKWSRIGKWASNATRVRITETEWSDAEKDAPVQAWEGVFLTPPYLNSLYKNRFQEYPLAFLVDSTTPSAQVP